MRSGLGSDIRTIDDRVRETRRREMVELAAKFPCEFDGALFDMSDEDRKAAFVTHARVAFDWADAMVKESEQRYRRKE